MNRSTLALLSGAVAGLLPPGSLPAQTPDLTRIEAVADSAAHAIVADGSTQGLTVAVARNGAVVFTRGYGTADVEMGVAAGAETVYGITSVTKQFTAAAIMRLVEAGKISLDDPITKYLPDYPVQGHHVTVRHLLNHTSGIEDYGFRHPKSPQWHRLDVAYEEMIDLWKAPFAFAPGEGHDYNNMGYSLLGEIISRVTETPYPEHVERDLFRPLGLDRTLVCEHRRVVPGRAKAYETADGGIFNAPYISTRLVQASGSLCSTVGDLVRWTHLLHGGQVVSPASLRQMTTPTVLSTGDTVGYGYGLYLDEFGGRRKVYHGGTNPWGAFVAHYPEDGLTIAVLTNSGSAGRMRAEQMERTLARTALGIVLREPPLSADDVARYEGTYTYPSGPRTVEMRVFAENGQLHMQPGRGRAFRLRHRGDHVFDADDDRTRFVFEVKDGRAEGFAIHESRWDVTRATRQQVP